MKKAQVVPLVLAAAAAGGLWVLSNYFMLGEAPAEIAAPAENKKTVNVLVATKDIPMGQKLGAGSLAWVPWPESAVSASSMITDKAQSDAREVMAEARARSPLFEGEPISPRKVVGKDKAGFISALLPKGMRAVSVGISERGSAGGFILPNDRVDVILTRDTKTADANGMKLIKSETVLTNVRVLAINQVMTKQNGADEQVSISDGKTATLELDPRQVEVLSMVQASGDLSLALRSVAENDDKEPADRMPEIEPEFDPTFSKKNGDTVVVVKFGAASNATAP